MLTTINNWKHAIPTSIKLITQLHKNIVYFLMINDGYCYQITYIYLKLLFFLNNFYGV